MGYGIGSANVATAKYFDEAIKVRKSKMKKPGFFKRWLLNQIKSAHEQEIDVPQQILTREPHSIDQPERAIQFTVYNANGGRVVETRRYDRQKDRNHQNLYIITSDQEFGREIDKIITMEALR